MHSSDTTSTADIKAALHGNFLFSSLDEEELDALVKFVWIESIPAQQTVVSENEEASQLYLIIDGGINVIKTGQFLSYQGKGGFFGEMALFMEGSKRSATCITAIDSVCGIIRKEDLDRFCDQYTNAGVKIYREIIKVLALRLRTTSADLATLMGAQVKKQEAVSTLVERAKRLRAEKRARAKQAPPPERM